MEMGKLCGDGHGTFKEGTGVWREVSEAFVAGGAGRIANLLVYVLCSPWDSLDGRGLSTGQLSNYLESCWFGLRVPIRSQRGMGLLQC